MNYRRATILAQEDATTAKTKTEDITLTDVISRIYVKFNYTNNGHLATAHPAKCVSKVEIVDGSDVLLSLSGQEIEALHFFDTRERRGCYLDYRNDCVGELVLPLNFGRWLYDPTLALDPTKFKNPQIKVTHNKASGGSAPDAATLEIFADVFDQLRPAPIGFLMSKEWYTYTLVANGYEYVDMPTDHVLKRALIKSQTVLYELSDQIAEVRLSEDNDKRIPIDLTMPDLMRLAAMQYGQYIEDIAGTVPEVRTTTWYLTPTSKCSCLISPIGSIALYTDAERYGGYIAFEAPTGPVGFKLHVSGFEPHGCIPLDFGNPQIKEDWYDVTKLGSLKLRLKGGSSPSGTCEVVTQQLRKY